MGMVLAGGGHLGGLLSNAGQFPDLLPNCRGQGSTNPGGSVMFLVGKEKKSNSRMSTFNNDRRMKGSVTMFNDDISCKSLNWGFLNVRRKTTFQRRVPQLSTVQMHVI
ncbi:hypothetical protein Salat_1926700 [Sesamum alatum]|uniref:Uncharacterized protein n=1 Tax=Sesamum alatum TaxID=300844 RepID=A0AAE2CIP7_9LAMI|nr:hypothetical protein Salat_1926700 [Sesamum alatum]